MKTEKFYFKGDVVKLIKNSSMHWFSTGRFGFELFMGLPVEKLDVYSLYVPEPELKQFKEYIIQNGGIENPRFPNIRNLRIIPTSEYQELFRALEEYKLPPPEKISDKNNGMEHKMHSSSPHEYPENINFETLIGKIREQSSNRYKYSLGDNYPHVINSERLGKDMKTMAPRYTDNLVERLNYLANPKSD